jgi:hypothetical protein
MGEKRTAYRLMVGKKVGKTQLGRPRHRWVVNIKMNLTELVWGGADWICLAQYRNKWRALVNAVMNLLFHKMLGNYGVATHLVACQVVFSSIELVS